MPSSPLPWSYWSIISSLQEFWSVLTHLYWNIISGSVKPFGKPLRTATEDLQRTVFHGQKGLRYQLINTAVCRLYGSVAKLSHSFHSDRRITCLMRKKEKVKELKGLRIYWSIIHQWENRFRSVAKSSLSFVQIKEITCLQVQKEIFQECCNLNNTGFIIINPEFHIGS